MKQWRIVIMVAVIALAILFIVQLRSSFSLSTSVANKEQRNESEPNAKVSQSQDVESSSSSPFVPTSKNVSRKLQLLFVRKMTKKGSNKDFSKDTHIHFCWQTQETTNIGECLRCSSYEKRVSPACLLSGNKQLVLCQTSNKKVYKSCPHVQWIEERNFWTFEGVACLLVIFSSLSVWQRNKKLDAIYQEKLRKKVSSDNV